MNDKEAKNKKYNLYRVSAAVMVIVFMVPFLALGELNDPVLSGIVQGTGTYFEVTDSSYLNIMLQSSEPVKLMLESVPEMIMMHLEAAEGATSAQITLTGFVPATTYYKYEDDYHNLETFTTDGIGGYSFVQDLSVPHLVFIQPNASTIFIPSDTSIGTWDHINRIYTLTTNVYETIQIDEDNLTLDGAGHTIIGSGTGSGVYLPERTGVTIKNINVQQFIHGIELYSSSGNTLINNSASNHRYGITLRYSINNILTNNTTSNTPEFGIYFYYSSDNMLTGNNVSMAEGGILMGYSNNNTLRYNTAWNVLGDVGGIAMIECSNNKIYNNNFIDNDRHIEVYGGTGNIFNLERPIGGNYWSGWTSPDDDGDGFVDYPYIFTGGQDNLPLNHPFTMLVVKIDIKPGSYPNAINLGSYGLVPVAILSDEEFDAANVEPETVELAGADVAVRGKSNKFMAHQEDVDGDGLLDLVVQVATANFDPDSLQDGYAILTGKTYDGQAIEGSDEITIVPAE